MVKILNSTYSKSDLEQVAANTTQINSEEKTQLLRLLKDFEGFFDITLGYSDTDPVHFELNPNSKQLNCKYYPVPRFNKGNFFKEL